MISEVVRRCFILVWAVVSVLLKLLLRYEKTAVLPVLLAGRELFALLSAVVGLREVAVSRYCFSKSLNVYGLL